MHFIQYYLVAFTLLTATAQSLLSQTTMPHQMVDSLKTETIKVKGITCSMDLKMIAANVKKLTGVHLFTAGKQGTTTTFEVTYNPALVSANEIFSAIEETGSCENPEDRPYKVKR